MSIPFPPNLPTDFLTRCTSFRFPQRAAKWTRNLLADPFRTTYFRALIRYPFDALPSCRQRAKPYESGRWCR